MLVDGKDGMHAIVHVLARSQVLQADLQDAA